MSVQLTETLITIISLASSTLNKNNYKFAEPPQEYHDSPLEAAFKETDPFYSNQGEAGTCVRHSIAKAIHAQALEKGTKLRIFIGDIPSFLKVFNFFILS